MSILGMEKLSIFDMEVLFLYLLCIDNTSTYGMYKIVFSTYHRLTLL